MSRAGVRCANRGGRSLREPGSDPFQRIRSSRSPECNINRSRGISRPISASWRAEVLPRIGDS